LDVVAVVGTPAGTVTGTAVPWATAAVASALIGTAAGAPAWPSFNPSMGGAPYWLTPHFFFMAHQYGFPVQPV
jgi:predicted MFS family arabinose efflux permease